MKAYHFDPSASGVATVMAAHIRAARTRCAALATPASAAAPRTDYTNPRTIR